ncbi:MAG TPA: peptidylprolyl isomerase [Caulobacteraceae bacterium]|nr:peptidylprolyl isomerase [Caulobacteraceae bacterium]
MPNLTKRGVLAVLTALGVSPALAQTAAAPVRVMLTTALGAITVELAADRAPITTANFLRYVDAKRFDGAAFYRAMKLRPAPPLGLIQGGLRGDPAKTFPPIAHESTRQTGLKHTAGTLSMARYAPGTATSEFFICIGDIPSLDADPTTPGDNLGFAAFGHVVDGMDNALKILAAPVSASGGDGAMRGQMLDPTVAIVTARRAS